MTAFDPADIPADLLDNPKIAGALEDFISEAIDEATDILLTGDLAARLALIKMVMGFTMTAKKNSGEAAAAKTLEQTRNTIQGVLE